MRQSIMIIHGKNDHKIPFFAFCQDLFKINFL